MINDEWLINDGLQFVNSEGTICENNGETVWTYNQVRARKGCFDVSNNSRG